MRPLKSKFVHVGFLLLAGTMGFSCGATGSIDDSSSFMATEGQSLDLRVFSWPSQSVIDKIFPQSDEITDTRPGQEKPNATHIDLPWFLSAETGAHFQATLEYEVPGDLKVWLIHNLRSELPSNQPTSMQADQILYADLSIDLPQSLSFTVCAQQPDAAGCQSGSRNQILLQAEIARGSMSGTWTLWVMDANTQFQAAATSANVNGRVVAWSIEVQQPKIEISLPFSPKNIDELPVLIHEDFKGPITSHALGSYDGDWELFDYSYVGNQGKRLELAAGKQTLEVGSGMLVLQRQFGSIGGKILRLEHEFIGGGKDSSYFVSAILDNGSEVGIQRYFQRALGIEFFKLPMGTSAIKVMLFAQDEEILTRLALSDLSILEPQAVCGDLVCMEVQEDRLSCPNDCARSLAVVVESALLTELSPSLDQYIQDLETQGLQVWLLDYEGHAVEGLRRLLRSEKNRHGIQGALLVGDLPVAQYQMWNQGRLENFPTDAYLEDLNANWVDLDGNGIFDEHGMLRLESYISRVKGSVAQLTAFFERAHRYRTQGHLIPPSAFIFKDDDFQEGQKESGYGLEKLYTKLQKFEDEQTTTRANYISNLGQGAEYVIHWIHGYSPDTLAFKEYGNFVHLSTNELRNLVSPIQASFFFLFTCMAADLRQDNLIMTYVMETPAGLAAVGSSRTFGSHLNEGERFHRELALGRSWGEAYINLFNDCGSDNLLGMILAGDPTLQVTGDLRAQP